MLRTTNKKVLDKIKNLIVEETAEDFGEGLTFDQVAQKIAEDFSKRMCDSEGKIRGNIQDTFIKYAEGLSLDSLFDYYDNEGQSRRVLADILEETEQEANKYTDQQADYLLTYLIFKVCSRAIYGY